MCLGVNIVCKGVFVDVCLCMYMCMYLSFHYRIAIYCQAQPKSQLAGFLFSVYPATNIIFKAHSKNLLSVHLALGQKEEEKKVDQQ